MRRLHPITYEVTCYSNLSIWWNGKKWIVWDDKLPFKHRGVESHARARNMKTALRMARCLLSIDKNAEVFIFRRWYNKGRHALTEISAQVLSGR
jgi:hypothetical protein